MMNFTFKKELVENRYMPGYGRLDWCSMFTISTEEKRIGRFFNSDEVSFLAFEEQDIRIDYIRKLFRHPQYFIVDQKNNQAIGGYERENYINDRTPYGRLFLGDKTFQCEKLNPDVNRRVFKKETWGHFKIRVGNDTEAVTYIIKIEHQSIWSASEANKPFEGTIQLEGNNRMLLFAGIFLVQQVLEFEDARSSD